LILILISGWPCLPSLTLIPRHLASEDTCTDWKAGVKKSWQALLNCNAILLCMWSIGQERISFSKLFMSVCVTALIGHSWNAFSRTELERAATARSRERVFIAAVTAPHL
jgi:hypothetical protein